MENSDNAVAEESVQPQTTTTTTEIPVVYYDGFDDTARNNRYMDDDDDDLEESDGFIFDFKPVGKSSAQPVHPLQKSEPISATKHRNDSWSGEPETTAVNNLQQQQQGSSSMADIALEVVDKLETTADSVAYELRVAIESGHLAKVKELFEKQGGLVDPNYVYEDTYWTPLMFAASMADLEMTKYLIEKGADPEYTDDTFSVLMCACGSREFKYDRSRLLDVVKLLVDQGSDVNSADKFYQTPLIYASRAGNTELVKLLAKLGAELDAMDDNSWTSLAHAAHKGNHSTVLALLRLGANPALQTNDYYFPHQLAKNSGFSNVESILRRFIENDKYEKKYLKNLVRDESDTLKLSSSTESAAEMEDEGIQLTTADEKQNKAKTADETKSDDDLTRFLKALNLGHLQAVFDAEKIKMKELLRFSFSDLTQIGIKDGPAKKLMSDEIRKLSLRYFSSSSLIPLRHDPTVNCNEAIAVISNISKHSNYMSANVRYIETQVVASENEDLLADGFVNAKLLECAKKCAEDAAEFGKCAKNLLESLNKKVECTSQYPVDHIVKTKEKSRHGPMVKWAAILTVAAGVIGVTTLTTMRLGILRKPF